MMVPPQIAPAVAIAMFIYASLGLLSAICVSQISGTKKKECGFADAP